MNMLPILILLVACSLSGFAQSNNIPTFTITRNDVVQSNIWIMPRKGKVTVKFAFTEGGATRLEKFYRAHGLGQKVRFKIGKFEWTCALGGREHFGRESFYDLPETDAKALEDGLRGRD